MLFNRKFACFADIAINRSTCHTVPHHRSKEMAVERKPVEGLPKVLAEAALTRTAEPRHLGEVHASGGCEIKFHGLDDECSERFA